MGIDQRRIERGRATFLPVLATCRDERQIVLMTDYSAEGCGLKGEIRAQRGAPITLRLGDEHEWDGTVSWNVGERFGVQHQGNRPFQLPTGDRYRSVRSPMCIPCIVYTRGQQIDAVVENISLHGLGLRSSILPTVGALISILIGRTAFEAATVRWVSEGSFGVRLTPGTDSLVQEVLRSASNSYSNPAPAILGVAA